MSTSQHAFILEREKKTSPDVIEPVKAEADDLHIVRLLMAQFLIVSTVMTMLWHEAKI